MESTATKVNLENLEPRGDPWKKENLVSYFKEITKCSQFYFSSFPKDYESVVFRQSLEYKKGNSHGSPIIRGYYKAYEQHYPIIISPDIIMLLIAQGFAHHVTKNAEILRNYFVNFDGKKTLTIYDNEHTSIDQLKKEDFDGYFDNFKSQISEYVGKELTETLNFDFSTTSNEIKIVGYTTLMSSMKSYFDYKVILCGCGFPYINVLGNEEDWNKVLKKLKDLEKYKLDFWVEKLVPIIEKIIKTVKGERDIQFWKNIIHKGTAKKYGASGMGSYDVDAIQGWLLLFYPYDRFGKKRSLEDYPLSLGDIGDLCGDLLSTPLKIKDLKGNQYDLEIRSGFIGMKQNEKKEAEPEIGWFIVDKSKDLFDPNSSEREFW